MLIQLGSIWYHYCNVPEETVSDLVHAQSAGRFFNGNVRVTAALRSLISSLF
jgi:hypothetical protein